MCVSAPFGNYDHNIVGEFELQQPIQWLAAKGAAIPWRGVSNMLCQRDKNWDLRKEFPDSSKRQAVKCKGTHQLLDLLRLFVATSAT